VSQSNTTQNLTAIGLLTKRADETFQSNRGGGHLQHSGVIKRDFDSVNESYANLNPCLESQSSNNYAQAGKHNPYMAFQSEATRQ